MNKVDCTVVEIVEPIHQICNDENCCWSMTVKVNIMGRTYTRVLQAINKLQLSRYIVGYTYTE